MSSTATLIYALAIAVLGCTGFLVYRNRPSSALHRQFGWTALSLIAWLATVLLFNRATSQPLLLLAGRLNFAATLWAALAALLFARTLVRNKRWDKRRNYLVGETVGLSLLTLFTGLIDRSESIINGIHQTTYGTLFALYALHIVLYLVMIGRAVLSPGVETSKRERTQLTIVGLGILLTGVVAVVTNLLLPVLFHITSLDTVGPLATLIYLGATAYAVVTEQLFDLRIVLKRTVVFALLLAFILAAYSGTVLFVSQVVPVGQNGLTRGALTTAAILLIAFAFDPLRRWLEDHTDRFLFQKDYRSHTVLSDLTRLLTQANSLDDVLTETMKSLRLVFRVHRAAIVLLESNDQAGNSIKRIQQAGMRSTPHLMHLLTGPLGQSLSSLEHPITSREAKDSDGTHASIRSILPSLGVEVLAPIFLSSELAGAILLGKQGSDRPYARDEVELLQAISIQVSSALQKVQIIEGDQKTTEFVHVAAHELLTPVAAAQGYISMVLDEHLGQVDEKARGYLAKSQSSLERLSLLVKDLLSVSRLEAGTVHIEPREADLEALLKTCLDQLLPIARKSKLTLTYTPPDKPLPLAYIDPAKATEVFINLIGNALKYTLEGGVTVYVFPTAENPAKLQVDIKDTGLGMDEEALSHLFTKFYRASSAETSKINGTGLGLYITKSLVEKMGGTISVTSKLGHGSVFSVTLPVSQIEPKRAAPAGSALD